MALRRKMMAMAAKKTGSRTTRKPTTGAAAAAAAAKMRKGKGKTVRDPDGSLSRSWMNASPNFTSLFKVKK